MKYQKETLEKSINELIGKNISEIYYYNKHELFESFHQLSDKIECVLFGGVLIKTTTDEYFNIKDVDYVPHLALGGIAVTVTPTPIDPAGRKNHIGTNQWLKYQDSEIGSFQLQEITYVHNNDTYTLPLGISFTFKNGATLHIYNAYVEGYKANEKKYELSRGESLTFFYDTESLQEYGELANGIVEEVSEE